MLEEGGRVLTETDDTTPDELIDQLKALCLDAGCELLEDRAYPATFGNRFASLRRDLFEYRITWDGKEGWFVLEVRLGPTGAEEGRAFQEIHREVVGRPPIMAEQALALRQALERRLL